jgi:plasmid maintenance system antidote protein VapI
MELAARNIKKIEFADLLGMKAGHFSELLHGKRHVSAATALKLESYWIFLQSIG